MGNLKGTKLYITKSDIAELIGEDLSKIVVYKANISEIDESIEIELILDSTAEPKEYETVDITDVYNLKNVRRQSAFKHE